MLRLQDVQADLSRLEMDIWVVALGEHFDLGCINWIILADSDVKFEPTLLEGRVRWSLDIGNPFVQIIYATSHEYPGKTYH